MNLTRTHTETTTLKMFLKMMLVGLIGSLSLGVFTARAEVDISVGVDVSSASDFYGPLNDSGSWVDVGSYGRCWHPRDVSADWRPYGDGHWEWTDRGWYWVSEERWAWACYHYGSWAFNPPYGWVWIPGTEWAPAWVTWREGGGHIGWAPRGPRGFRQRQDSYVFVETSHFNDRVRSTRGSVNNAAFFNGTRQISGRSRETRSIGGRQQKIVVNKGPGVDDVQKATGRKFAATPVQELDRKTAAPSTLKHRTAESQAKGKVPDNHQVRPKATNERKVAPAPNVVRQSKVAAPNNEPRTDKTRLPQKEVAQKRIATPSQAAPPQRKTPPKQAAPVNRANAVSQRPSAPPQRQATHQAPPARPSGPAAGGSGNKGGGEARGDGKAKGDEGRH